MIPDTALLWAGVKRFEDILKKDPRAYSFAPLADLYLSLGLLDDALQAARKGCAIHPDFAAGQMALARAALENSLKSEAKSALESVVRITPENIAAQRLLADIYTAENDLAAAQRCLGIVSSLEPAQSAPEPPAAAAAEVFDDDEITDLDILELTDDLIEDEAFDDAAASPFSAAPERPSLGDAQLRSEPYLLETAPPIYEEEQAEASFPPVKDEMAVEAVEEQEPPAVVTSATIAELYVTQGFVEKGAEIYRQLLLGEPDNQAWKQRLEEILEAGGNKAEPAMEAVQAAKAAPAMEAVHAAKTEQAVESVPIAAAKADSTEGVIGTLHGWLANIGRVRECRTKRA